ncbi:thiamine phosphate synthase [Desulfobaculum sp. SPO524]|uniref:thiamine phosphate synthase n=1 Tax=Desulfobaculum sp. SPO524 TaxID=3378071 RepID=UPI003854A503
MSARYSFDLGVYLVTDTALCGERGVERTVREAVAGGATLVQLREKHLGTRDFVDRARALMAAIDDTDVRLLINDRVDVALACGAHGVHVGQSDMHVEDVRRLVGPRAIIGLSVETLDDVRAAEALDVDYYGVSPVFATPTKTDTAAPWGLEGLRGLKAQTRRPLVGIGGIDAANAADVVTSGADGVAVVSAICAAPSPRGAAAELAVTVAQAKASRRG